MHPKKKWRKRLAMNPHDAGPHQIRLIFKTATVGMLFSTQ
jgi:hypothetical protein